MKKKLRNTIIGMVVAAIVITFILYLRYGTVVWWFLFVYPIVATMVKLHLDRRREEREKAEGVR